MGDQLGAAAGGAGGHPRRGFHVPDVRVVMGLKKRNDRPLSTLQGSGNLNLVDNMTDQELEKLFFEFFLSYGVSRDELATDIRVPRGIADQDDLVANDLNLRAREIYQVWFGSRREFYYLTIKAQQSKSPQFEREMKAIHTAIEGLKIDLEDIFSQLRDRSKVAFDIPEQLKKEMAIPKPPKPEKSKKYKKRR